MTKICAICGHENNYHWSFKPRACVKMTENKRCYCSGFKCESNIILLIKKHNDNKTLSKRSTRKNKS